MLPVTLSRSSERAPQVGQKYLGSMAKIQKAVEYFQDNSPDSPEHTSELCSLMTRHNKFVFPVLILDLIGGDDDLEVQEIMSLEHLPKSVLQDVICISYWLVEYSCNQDFMNVYYKICSSQLDHFIKAWRSISGRTVLFPYCPSIPNKRKKTPAKKPVKWPGIFIRLKTF